MTISKRLKLNDSNFIKLKSKFQSFVGTKNDK